ncbi:MAG: sensor histidine kinase [Flavobacteriales bacterium]|nr:sensor histidine kinase [Flavobacteriales bacterium]
MKIENPKEVALLIASLVAGATLMVFLTVHFALGLALPIFTWVVILTIVFGSAYFISWWSVETFLHGKIQLLFRSIHSTEKTKEKLRDVVKLKDALAEVQKDVEEWASVKQSEIQTLKAQAKFRRDFIGNLAHELKTPIFNMQGYLLTLIEGGLEDKKINVDYLNRADRNLERLIALVEDLDSISKLESGNEVLKTAKFNMVELVEEVFNLFELRARDKEIELRFNKKYDKPIFVKADKSKILQVLTNLVTNAISYGQDKGHCEVRFFDMSHNILIEVADDGIGVRPDHLPRLFERFYRVDRSRSRHEGGTGLGLAICKHIIESHGQTISVRSVVDKGTTFSFTLEKAK